MAEHGGNVRKAAAELGVDPAGLIDFSANLNPLGIPPNLKRWLLEGIDRLGAYPDPDCRELHDALALRHGIPESRICAGNGASEIISLMLQVLDSREIHLPAPCFSEYAEAAEACGTRTNVCEMTQADGFTLDPERFLDAMPDSADTVLFCNPNNPTSRLLHPEQVEALIDRAAARGCRVLVDEAFIELTPAGESASAVRLLERHSGLFIIRSLTKLFAIPGLRVGYALGAPDVIGEMRRRKPRWSVNALACGVGRALTEDAAYLEETARWISTEKDRFADRLSRLPGLHVYPPDANFVLLRLEPGRPDAAALRARLAGKGFLIRDASDFHGLDSRHVRVAVRSRAENDALAEALAACLQEAR